MSSRLQPADKGDYRFNTIALEEPEMGETHLVQMVDDTGAITDSWTTDTPYEAVEAFRETQSMTLEERFDYYAERGW